MARNFDFGLKFGGGEKLTNRKMAKNFAFDITSIGVASILNMHGIDRIHLNTHETIVEIAQQFLTLLAQKSHQQALLTGRNKICSIDLIAALDFVGIHPRDLEEFAVAVQGVKKVKFEFPRLEPAEFPTGNSF